MNGESSKKVSFGFTKVSKKTNLIQLNKKDEPKEKDIQYIQCLEEKSIKIVGGEEKEKSPPVIPLRDGNKLKDSIKAAITLRLNRNVQQSSSVSDMQGLTVEKNGVEIVRDSGDVKKEAGPLSSSTNGEVFNEVTTSKQQSLTLDELAAKEIIEDMQKAQTQQVNNEESSTNISLTPANLLGQKESTLDDYESMPIADFGLAMLRGMGWDPKKGIGLNEQVVTPIAPTLRPKGMGLGADKVPAAGPNVTTSNGEVLVLKKEAPVKVLTGQYNNCYGKIAGFDELPGRLMVRLAKNNVVISLNELMVQLVSTKEFMYNIGQVDNTDMKIAKQNDDQGGYGLNVKGEDSHSISRQNLIENPHDSPKQERKYYRKEDKSDSDGSRKRKIQKKQVSNLSDSSPIREQLKESSKMKKYNKPRDNERYEKSRNRYRKRSSSSSSSSTSTSDHGKYNRKSSYRYSRFHKESTSRSYPRDYRRDRTYENKKKTKRNRRSISRESDNTSGRKYNHPRGKPVHSRKYYDR